MTPAQVAARLALADYDRTQELLDKCRKLDKEKLLGRWAVKHRETIIARLRECVGVGNA